MFGQPGLHPKMWETASQTVGVPTAVAAETRGAPVICPARSPEDLLTTQERRLHGHETSARKRSEV